MEAPIKLRGQDLLDFVKAQAGRPEGEVAKAAGYVRSYKRKDDEGEVQEYTSPQTIDFHRALTAAQGVALQVPASATRKAPKERALHIQASGKLILSPCYRSQVGLEKGNQVIVEEVDGKLVISKHQEAEQELPFQQEPDPGLQFYNHQSPVPTLTTVA